MVSGVGKVVIEVEDQDRAKRFWVTPDHLPTSNVMFRCGDLSVTYEELSARGVAFPQPPVEQPFGSWSMFDDPEGNRFALEQTESDAP